MRSCNICGHPAVFHSNRCARCKKWCAIPPKAAHRDALLASWSKKDDAFLCHYTGLILDAEDTSSPFHLDFDHPVPGDDSRLVACAKFINEMKHEMTESEFRINIPLLARHFQTGEPIDRGLFRVDYYAPKAKKPASGALRASFGRAPLGWFSETCQACTKKPQEGRLYCARCEKILYNKRDWKSMAPALKAAYDPIEDRFRCHYTGFPLQTDNWPDPWYLNFDHRFPGKPGDYVVAAQIINEMKTELSEDEFRKVVVELARHFETGEPYDRDVIGFEYWDRLSMPGA